MLNNKISKTNSAKFLLAVFVLAGLVSFSPVKAEETGNSNNSVKNINRDPEIQKLREEIVALKKKHVELKAQVEKGEITKEEARKIWLDLIAQMRAKKDLIISKRVENIETRLNTRKEKKTEIIQTLNEFKQERQQLNLDRKAVGEKIQKKEMTREEGKKMLIENKEKRKKNRVEKREEMKEIRKK